MKIRAGTSGYSYKEWKGSFYPEDLAADEMLAFYARRLPAVEINNTFYRLPRQDVLESWAERVPEDFRFVLKASRRITHFGRLRGVESETDYLIRTVAASLRERAGALLFQLPPNFRKDTDRLTAFLDLLPRGVRAAFEFRHPSWFDEDVLSLLRERACALCVAETEDGVLAREVLEETGPEEAGPEGAGPDEALPLLATAEWGYLRLRKAAYSDRELEAWTARVKGMPWEEAYVFFKHEEAGHGPRLARRFLEAAGEEVPGPD